MHSRVFEIESKKGMTEGINYDLPEWWTNYYPDWYEELDEEEVKDSMEKFLGWLDTEGDVIDFGGERARKNLADIYQKARAKAKEFLSLSFEDFKEYKGIDLVEELASIVNEKYGIWFYNPAEGEEICTLDEMLHRGGKYYLTGRVWDYHW
jgi:hypothetical protein